MFLLDTNVVSELRKRNADTNVVRWSRDHMASSLFISAITVLELETGVLRIRDPTQGAALRLWLEHNVLKAFAGRILAVDTQVARRCAARPTQRMRRTDRGHRTGAWHDRGHP